MPSEDSQPDMPPVASSSATPHLQHLESISSPVPDVTVAPRLRAPPRLLGPDDIRDENVNFLRSRYRSPPESSASNRARRRRVAYLPPEPLVSWDNHQDEQRSPRPSVDGSRRFPIVRRYQNHHHPDRTNAVPSYEGRMSNTIRSIYGWAPGSSEDEEEPGSRRMEDQQDIDMRDADEDTPRGWSVRSSSSRRSSRRNAPWNGDASETSAASERWIDPTSTLYDSSLLRLGPRFASHSRRIQDFLLERERSRSARDYEDQESSSGRANRQAYGEGRERVRSHRHYLRENPPSSRLKRAIRYLERVRFMTSNQESITSAVEDGLVSYDDFKNACNDGGFLMSTATLSPPAVSSWLQPGVSFRGFQKAASAVGVHIVSHRISRTTPAGELLIVNGSEPGRISVATSSGRRYLADLLPGVINATTTSSSSSGGGITNHHEPKEEHWPVKVTIQSVDYSTMTLSGTMEAFNIPDKTSPTRESQNIVTFLEGEIIDLKRHTLETTNFAADVEIDCTYWRELQPFRDMSDSQMVKNLVNRRWVTEELTKRWILMRWKERCFVTPTDARQGLTISGFYYISLCRETGEIEGLYYDPGSSPYQQLSLKPEHSRMVFPTYEFR
ncbi:hypothetical protein VTN31DRAFT_5311 [Thermomyces dupontii]|uniref:uncharacterized protein n=1 Tax=Talaromyces thermophilus TaxID=28565 RepID=UPI0037423964